MLVKAECKKIVAFLKKNLVENGGGSLATRKKRPQFLTGKGQKKKQRGGKETTRVYDMYGLKAGEKAKTARKRSLRAFQTHSSPRNKPKTTWVGVVKHRAAVRGGKLYSSLGDPSI